MGVSQSKPLRDISTDELAAALTAKGPKFEPYARAVKENCVNGALLESLGDEELLETFEDLEITNRLHKRVLAKEWQRAKQWNRPKDQISNEIVAELSTYDHKQETRDMAKNHPAYVNSDDYPDPDEDIHRALVRAASEYDLTPSTPAKELTPFDSLTETLMNGCSALYAGVHLIDDDGHTCASSRYYMNGQVEGCEPQTRRLHCPRELSTCYYSIMTSKSDFVSKIVPPGGTPFQIATKQSHYVGHILRSESGQRIGIICVVKQDDGDNKQEILSGLAKEAENQLQLRKVLLNRAKMLREQVATLQAADVHNNILLPAFGPLSAVTKREVDQHLSSYPSPDEIAAMDKPCRCSELPEFQDNRAAPEEMTHLSPSYWDEVEQLGIDRTPVSKDDRERVAVTEALGIWKLDPASTTARKIQNLAQVAKRLFETPLVILTFHTHEKSFTIVGCGEPLGASVLRTGSDGCPFLCEQSRASALCNYPIHTKKTFVVHDTYVDESFSFLKPLGHYQFYSGVPLIFHGYAIASLCLADFRARPDFTKAREIQQEQIAKMMLNEISTWSIQREIDQLEGSRRLLSSSRHIQASPPEHEATLVFTDVQGSTRLWESNADAMHQALQLHDTIVRKCCSDYQGYEVHTEGDAFHIAFHDAVDAVEFAIKVQEELHTAAWSDNILALPDASDDGRGFRGLRVRMAIHSGKVTCQDNGVTGRREYTGKTVYIAKYLESMAHGGQILATIDVWNVASYVAESSLGSPQVIDLGTHVLWTGKAENEGVISKGVVQIVPAALAFDYYGHHKANGSVGESGSKRAGKGRQFPPPISRKRLSLSFHDAPNSKSVVTMVFVSTTEINALYDDPSMVLACLSSLIGSLLGSGPGYQCKDFMVAFNNPSEAAMFGLLLQETLSIEQVYGENLSGLLKVGFHHGEFTSMGPHQTSGRAEYFGKVVNRAARIAAAAEPGKVYLGCVKDETPVLETGVDVEFVVQKELKGVQEEMALYACVREQQRNPL